MTLAEVSKILKLHIETVREMVRNEEIPAYKVTRRDYRVKRSDLDEFLRKRRNVEDKENKE